MPCIKPVQAHDLPVSSDALLVADFLVLEKEQRILKLGLTSGTIAISLASRQTVNVVAVESDREVVQKAKTYCQQRRAFLQGTVTFKVGDITSPDFIKTLGTVDQVVLAPSLSQNVSPESAGGRNPDSLEQAVAAAQSVLKPEGDLSLILAPSALDRVFVLLKQHDFKPTALLPVYTPRKHEAELLLVRATLKGSASLRLLYPRYLRAITTTS